MIGAPVSIKIGKGCNCMHYAGRHQSRNMLDYSVKSSLSYDPGCRECPRLSGFLAQVKTRWPHYFCRPVPAFGDPRARLLIVGLAPGKHGANATGRPFTGDHAGKLLYRTLHEFGYGSRPVSDHAGDDLVLRDCRITNAVKCLPPGNRPTGPEQKNCSVFLRHELSAPEIRVILALGQLAHNAVLRCLGQKQVSFGFAHNRTHLLEDGRRLVDSYHCSRYNTQTGRLTENMFCRVFETVTMLLGDGAGGLMR